MNGINMKLEILVYHDEEQLKDKGQFSELRPFLRIMWSK
jgi:hypothetical protein